MRDVNAKEVLGKVLSTYSLQGRRKENPSVLCRGLAKAAKRASRSWQALGGGFQDDLLLLAEERRELSRRQPAEVQPCICLLASKAAFMLAVDLLCF